MQAHACSHCNDGDVISTVALYIRMCHCKLLSVASVYCSERNMDLAFMDWPVMSG